MCTALWRSAGGAFMPPVSAAGLPASLLERFAGQSQFPVPVDNAHLSREIPALQNFPYSFAWRYNKHLHASSIKRAE